VREPIQIAGHRGFRYHELSPELLGLLPRWLRERHVDDGVDLKRGRVFRWKDLVVKFSPPSARFRDRFRPGSALRAAEWHAQLAPLAMAQPHLALEQRNLTGLHSQLLVSEFVEGVFLHEIFRDDPHAVGEYARFVAELHGRGFFHGDLHSLNLLWDGERWVLIDVEGFRGGLHRLRPARLVTQHWGLISSNLMGYAAATDEELRPIFDAYIAHSTLSLNVDKVWSDATRLASDRFALWGLRPGETLPIGT